MDTHEIVINMTHHAYEKIKAEAKAQQIPLDVYVMQILEKTITNNNCNCTKGCETMKRAIDELLN